ncbi:hypothetical protein FQN54_008000 [Arachnomyces sp. PD_36]|nr:hypothetical protein FQN54_008000 [Arachnomyces sp. PD_36]
MAEEDPSKPFRDRLRGGYRTDSVVIQYSFVACFVIAWYNVLELTILLLVTFKRYRGLYFWSLLVATLGILPFSFAFSLRYFDLLQSDPLSGAILAVGSWTMVTGQALVLWSRLHFVLHSPSLLRRALWMIIVTAIVLHIPTTILVLGVNSGVRDPGFIAAYIYVAKIQLAGFCAEEITLSALYIWGALQLLKFSSRKHRVLIWQLLVINCVIILMDTGILISQYVDEYAFQIVLKPTVYSIKLKLEYAVLSQLVDFVKGRDRWELGAPFDERTPVIDITNFSGASNATTPSGTARSENDPRTETVAHP